MSQSETPKSEDQQAFEEWFVNNYPPSCVISDPAWHAPKIYRAATRDIVRSLAAKQEQIAQVERERNELRVRNQTQLDTLIQVTGKCQAVEARCAELREALQPFTHDDLCKQLGGNVEGDNSPVFGREKAILRLGDFRRARAALAKEAKS